MRTDAQKGTQSSWTGMFASPVARQRLISEGAIPFQTLSHSGAGGGGSAAYSMSNLTGSERTLGTSGQPGITSPAQTAAFFSMSADNLPMHVGGGGGGGGAGGAAAAGSGSATHTPAQRMLYAQQQPRPVGVATAQQARGGIAGAQVPQLVPLAASNVRKTPPSSGQPATGGPGGQQQ